MVDGQSAVTSAFHPKADIIRVSAFDPLRTLRLQTICTSVRVSVFFDMLSKRAPHIVVLTLCAALVAAWTGAPIGLSNSLAIIIGVLAVVLFAARARRSQFKTTEELGFIQFRDRIAYELAGKGSPPGFYLLSFFGIITIFLTGFDSPYSKPAWAGFFLGVVWGIANAHYPADEPSKH